MGLCCGKKGIKRNPDGQNWVCEFCGKGLTEEELKDFEKLRDE